MKRVIVFDIDGTLADNKHRLHFIQQEPKDWDSFFKECWRDSIIEPTVRICQYLFDAIEALESKFGSAPYEIIFCSGRPERVRRSTVIWLSFALSINVDKVQLYMRADGDHRPDDKVKEELLAKMRADGYEPFLVFDDRNRVVDMWRRNGIQCCQVAPGDF